MIKVLEELNSPQMRRRISLYFMKIYIWTMLLLIGLCATVCVGNIYAFFNKNFLEFSFSTFIESAFFAFIMLCLCFALFLYVIRYLLWVPWSIYSKYWDYNDSKYKEKKISQDDILKGLKNTSYSDLFITFLFLLIEFFIAYFIFSSFNKPKLLFLCILILPLIDILLSILDLFLKILLVICTFFIRGRTRAKNILKLQEKLNFKYFIPADGIDIGTSVLSIIVFFKFYCNDINFVHIWMRLDLLYARDLFFFYFALSLGIIIGSALIIGIYFHSLKRIFIVLSGIMKIKLDGSKDQIVVDYSNFPIEYQQHKTKFLDNIFHIDNRVYIPTDETEYMVKYAVSFLQEMKKDRPLIIDVGTGSGNIAISLVKEFESAIVYATDISKNALEVASINKCILGADNVKIIETDLIEGLPKYDADLIIANLPWGSKRYLLKSNTPERLRAMPEEAVLPGEGIIDPYLKLISSIRSKKIKTTLLIETGVIPENELKKHFPDYLNWKFIPFEGYSICKIKF